MKSLSIALALAAGFVGFAMAGETPAPEGASAYILWPHNGATVSSPVTVVFGLRGMGVAPAGTEAENTGHHHLLIDAKFTAYDEPVPSDDNYRHFGGGQTETRIELAPGVHTLQLLLGDWSHVPHDPAVMSETITITVE